MMLQSRSAFPSHLHVAQATLEVLADDGVIDLPEIDYLLAVAVREGAVTPAGRSVLGRIFDTLPPHAVSPEAHTRLDQIRHDFGL